MDAQPKFIPVSVSNIINYDVWKYTSSQEWSHCQRIRNCFYRAVALWEDGISDKNTRKSLGKVIVYFRKIQSFLYCHLSSNSLEEKKDHGKPGRNCGHIFTCASLLKPPVCTFASSQEKGFSLAPIIDVVSFSFTTAKKQCRCLIT